MTRRAVLSLPFLAPIAKALSAIENEEDDEDDGEGAEWQNGLYYCCLPSTSEVLLGYPPKP